MRLSRPGSSARAASLGLLALVLFFARGAMAAPGYFRFPDLRGDKLVFAAEGDLWVASDRGGTARRLTSHPGLEYFPRFSPDGKWIAFTGEYGGNRDVYVIPSEGGEPRRLTWHPASDEVLGWTPDGKRVLFRSRAENPLDWEIFAISAEGGDPEKLPVGWASRIAIDPSTGRWAFSRKTWETATWKRYRGGTAPDIWVGHPDRADFKAVTDFPGINAYPMWHGEQIYFLSDQGGTANIWSMKADGSDRKRHTDLSGWDARWPAMDLDGRIVFAAGSDLQILNVKDGGLRPVPVELPSDRVLTRVRYPEAGATLTWFELSPKGDRLAVTTRGEIFSVPVKNGVTLPITRGSGARESYGRFSADGKRLVYVSDAAREEDIRVIDAWGRGAPKIVAPAGAKGWHFPPAFSPNGRWIAYADETQSLYVAPAEGGAPSLVDRSTQAEIREYVFSPDGRWLAYTKALATDYNSIWLYDTKSGKTRAITGPYTSDSSPSWDPEGRYLYFLSERATNPVLDTRDLQNVEIKNVIPHMLLLRKEVKNPFANSKGLPDEDSDKPAEKSKDKEADDRSKGKDKAKPDASPAPVEIDLDGLSERFVAFPVDRDRYSNLTATPKGVFYLANPIKGMAESPSDGPGDEPRPDATLVYFDLEKRKAQPFLEGISEYRVSAKGEKVAVMKARGEIYVLEGGAPPQPAALAEAKVSLDGVVVELDPREEWAQIYYEAWRRQRDFFWDPAMGSVDWKAVRDRYAALLPRLGVREELRDLIGELIGELNNSHTYVQGGDPGVKPARVATGLLGIDVKREGDAYKVVRIHRGDPADNVRSPLDEPGVNVPEGSYILAVNRAPFKAGRPFHAGLEKLAGRDVVLTVNARPDMAGARDVVVKTLESEKELRYADWVRRNRAYVAEKTGGRIGYLHLSNMGDEGMTQFNTWFYPQLDKEGLVVDVRWNGGGFVSQMILERLRRKVLTFDRSRGGGVNSYPYRTLNGPFVVLTNESAGSDGDIFPAAVQLEKLAPVIGMRSWGGVVGIRGDKPLVDGGLVTEPEFAWWDPRDGWTIENRGVVPDIPVQNPPQEVAKGLDTQLDRGIAEVLRLHAQHPPIKPAFGPVRDRRREAFRKELEAKGN